MSFTCSLRRLALLGWAVLPLGALWAVPSGTQTILTTSGFSDLGATLTGPSPDNHFVLSARNEDTTAAMSLNIAPAGNGQGAYITSPGSTTYASITVAANGTTVSTFELTGAVFDEFITNNNYQVTVIGTRADNTTVSSNTAVGEGTGGSSGGGTGPDTYAVSFANFAGVQLKSFTVIIDGRINGRPGVTGATVVGDFSIVSFTVANAQAPDTTPPTISIGAPSASLTRSGPVSYLVTYADANFNASTLSAGNVTLNSTGTANATVGVTGSGTTRTVTLSSITGDGTLGISIAAGTASDTSGNLAPAAGPSTTFTVDNTAPSITSATTASGTYNTDFSYTIAASGSPASFGATGLPAGLSVNTSNGAITGTPTQTGSFTPTISATDAAGNIGSTTLNLTIAKAAATVTLGNLSQIYTGAARTVSATTTPSGLTVNFTYDGSPTAPTNAGSYAIVGTINDTNYQGTASGTLNVAKAAATVTLGSLSQTYTGAARTVSATTTPSGLTVNFTYDGSPTAPTNAGSYAIVGTINDTNYQGTASGTLNVAKAAATLTLGDLSQTYTGAARTVSATTTPSGLAVTFTYDGFGSAPTNAGSYAIVGTINDTNYEGTASGTLSVAKVGLTVTADAKSRAYGFANPELTATVTGFVGGDTVGTAVTGSPDLSTTATASSGPGAYTITTALGTLSATNYTFSFVDGILTVRLLSLADWEEENFLPEDLGDPMIAGPDADPDFDGVTNLYEYAFGTDPNDFMSGPGGLVYTGSVLGGGTLDQNGQPITRVEVTASGTVTSVLFVRRNAALSDDLTYLVQFTSNGTTWVTSSATPVVLASDGLFEVVAVPYPSITSGKRTRGFRVVPSIVD